MNKINDGGPAFPIVGDQTSRLLEHPGMTLRDYLAGQALAGFDHHNSGYVDFIAKTCYQLADAMLAQRQKGEA